MMEHHQVEALANLAIIEASLHLGGGVLKDVRAVLFDKIWSCFHTIEFNEVAICVDQEAVEMILDIFLVTRIDKIALAQLCTRLVLFLKSIKCLESGAALLWGCHSG